MTDRWNYRDWQIGLLARELSAAASWLLIVAKLMLFDFDVYLMR